VSAPPTIAHLKSDGLDGLFVTCANAACRHSTPFTFAALGLPDELQFPAIAQRRRFVCTRCGARAVNIMPAWRKFNAGNGVQPLE
jgi:hypothetical protein